ncbi:hypothetical protein [Leptospira santarosai]|uniref:hypothetical protein n=1 Tax=Leptospira santarosai TaxID=28183 RepID=UPI0002E27FC6|nr:hypothetical protein [Leptospira santarosai]
MEHTLISIKNGTSLLSAFLIYFPDRWDSILKISKAAEAHIGRTSFSRNRRRWILTVANDELPAKLKQNRESILIYAENAEVHS